MTELDEFMDYCYKTNVEVALGRLKESARLNESMLHYWKVVKKRRKRDAMKRKITLRPITVTTYDDKRNIIHTFSYRVCAKFKITN